MTSQTPSEGGGTASDPAVDAAPAAAQTLRPVWSAEGRRELLRGLAAGPGRLAILVHHATGEQLDRTDGGWSAREILAHLADLEFNLHYTARVARILYEDEPVLCAAESDWRAIEHRHLYQDARVALGGYTLARKHLVAVASELEQSAWMRCGMHPESGRVRLFDVAWGFVRHDRRHMDRIATLVGHPGWRPGP